MTRYSTFDGVTIPSAGRGGWFHGTDRWSEGEFFRYEFTDFHLVTQARSAGPSPTHRSPTSCSRRSPWRSRR
jgi:hypothetical protein